FASSHGTIKKLDECRHNRIRTLRKKSAGRNQCVVRARKISARQMKPTESQPNAHSDTTGSEIKIVQILLRPRLSTIMVEAKRLGIHSFALYVFFQLAIDGAQMIREVGPRAIRRHLTGLEFVR